MPSTYKTPGVYIEEISKFPPSVAQVETAVPAFIGYTQNALKNGEDLTGKAVKVTSLAEYNSYFGEGSDSNYETYLDTNDAVSQVVPTLNYYMYDSIRMFYANGGGKCYIISVGLFPAAVSGASLNDALKVLEKEDEPTMIVCPDAALLSGTGLYDFQVLALAQCAKLGDRVLICDLLKVDEKTAGQTLDDRVTDFRDKVGINDLKYGAAYMPYIKSSLPKTVRYRNVELRRGIPSSFTATSMESFTSDNGILQVIYDLQNASKAVDDLTKIVSSTLPPGILSATSKTLSDEFKKLFDAYPATGTDSAKVAALQPIYGFCAAILAAVYDEQQSLPSKVTVVPNPASKTSSKSFGLRTDIDSLAVSTGIKTTFQTLVQHQVAYNASTGIAAPGNDLFSPAADFQDATKTTGKSALLLQFATMANIGAFDIATLQDAALNASYTAAANDTARIDLSYKAAASAYISFVSFFIRLQSTAAQYERTLDDSLANISGFYKNILDKIRSSVSELPPSGAVAGIYAKVDNDRGVWKAPANVSLAAVSGPSVLIDNTTQDDLNVDVNAGKSINAIRSFTGKGTLIWGARTLAGNDNEWRYISVRRFFNMVEESVKKSSSQFVFEPNDANTWVKIKAMIENFLTILWRQGALAGAKPEHAFYVKVGLGETMTAIDILEGRMNIEIGMAAVRPAEFIILKFSHKMQES